MFSATRHAQRLAGNFLEDVDDFQRASRAADRRAMSHFEDASNAIYFTRPSRSMSVSRVTTIPADTYYSTVPRTRSISVEPRYATYVSPSVRPVTVVGSRYTTPYYYRSYPRYYTYDTYYPRYGYYTDYPTYTSSYKYWPYTPGAHYSHYLPTTTYYTRNDGTVYDYTLPTSGLRASVPSWDIGYRPLSLSRAYSYSNLVDPAVVSIPAPVYAQPRRTRFGSVPPISPAAAAQYHRATRVARPVRYITQYYSDLTTPTPINTKYVYQAPMGLPPRPIYRPIVYGVPNGHRGSLDDFITAEVMAERRRIDRKMDDLLSYKLPDASIFDSLKGSLRKVNDKMDVHRTLLDRYSAIDMSDGGMTVEDRINNKCRELSDRRFR